MIDPRVLKYFGTSNEQLRTFFTAHPAGKDKDGNDRGAHDLYAKKDKFTKWVSALIADGRRQCYRNYRHFAAVDLMMDSQPILPENIPLMAYAQGKINIETVEKELATLNCAEEFVEKRNCAKQGEAEDIKKSVNLVRLQEVCVNVGRSFIARRANAQNNKYDSLRPFFKYESRGTSMVDKLRGEAMSQYAEIMVDSFNYRHEHRQCVHAMFQYRTVLFPAGAWDVSTQTHIVPQSFNGSDVREVQLEGEEGKLKLATVIEREGVRMVRPNPARVIFDTSQPLSSINSDTGCRWIGFFDVQRYGDIQNNSDFYNTKNIGFSTSGISVIDQNRAYFDLIFAGQPINFPKPTTGTNQVDFAASNEIKSQSFIYSEADSERSVFVTDMRVKVVPKEWGMGSYPHPVWLRLVVASDDTVIYAEWLPSLPAIYWGHNEDDTRLLNISTAHEIMPWQDQLSNIFSQLLMKMKHALFRVILINKDIVGETVVNELRKKLDSPSYYINPHLLEVSFKEHKDMDLDLQSVIKIIGAGEGTNANESEYINNAFKAIIQILAIMERLLNMSPQEQGQPAPREITAEEVAAIESTTQATYNAIGSSIDEARAAWKRIVYESAMAWASEQVYLPMSQRFSKETIEAAGFEVEGDPAVDGKDSSARRGRTVIGSKRKLVHAYVFSSRDGGDRSSNREAANTLQQFLVGILPVLGPEALGKKRIFDIINEMFRLLSSYDLKLELNEEESDTVMAPDTEQKIGEMQKGVEGQLGELMKQLEEHEQEIGGVSEAITKIGDFIKEYGPVLERLRAAA